VAQQPIDLAELNIPGGRALLALRRLQPNQELARLLPQRIQRRRMHAARQCTLGGAQERKALRTITKVGVGS
jgi:hypothetical protein